MNLIKAFFTEGPNIVEIYYLILGISFIGIVLYNFLPKHIALKLFIPYRIVSYRVSNLKKEQKEYDWSKALNRHSIFLLIVFISSIIILLLTILFGTIVVKVGLGILVLISIVGSFWVDPVEI